MDIILTEGYMNSIIRYSIGKYCSHCSHLSPFSLKKPVKLGLKGGNSKKEVCSHLAREKIVESYLVRRVKQAGGKCYKFVSPGNNGVPDRIVLLPIGSVYFVETKAPGEKPRPSQLVVHRDMKRLGFSVRVLDSKNAVDEFMKEVMSGGVQTARLSEDGDTEDL
jgi:hypothetical protein